MPVLTMLDSIAVQRFIFSSNRLKDVVGGSFLAEQMVNVDKLSPIVKAHGGSIIFAAGGNALLKFPGISEAREVVGRFSRIVLEEIPDFEIVAHHREYVDGEAAKAIPHLQQETNREKMRRAPSAPLLGLSVTEVCSQTGLPADHFDDRDACINASIAARREPGMEQKVAARWQEFLPQRQPDGLRFNFSDQLDDIGRSRGDTSLIGVIHVDGNGVGKKIELWLEESAGKPDSQVFAEYSDFSAGLARLAQSALRNAIDRIVQNVTGDQICSDHRLGFSLKKSGQTELILPLRPIVCSGDDITLVCDGRLALSVAQALLETFESSSVPSLGNIKASAGIALVSTHSPFRKAYDMAEELCGSAKRFLKSENLGEQSSLDWAMETFSTFDGALEAREQLYRINHNQWLTQRPYLLSGTGAWEHRSWKWLSGMVIHGFETTWKESRNKVKHIPEATRQGPVEVKQTLGKWRAVYPGISFPGGIPETGFEGGKTALLDAVELFDIFLPLEGGLT